jgi:hypothetical protein
VPHKTVDTVYFWWHHKHIEQRNSKDSKMNTAAKAHQDASIRSYATKVTEFTRCKVYDFADGSFLTVWGNGRTEVNAVTA